MSPRKRKTTPEQAVTRRISKAEHVPDSIIANNKHNHRNTLNEQPTPRMQNGYRAIAVCAEVGPADSNAKNK
jgi:hypothetical protein